MRTQTIAVQTLCVPCANHCRYCLLSYDGRLRGADYARSEQYAKRFHEWIQKTHPEQSFMFSFGYSMEHPDLMNAIDFMRSIGSPGGEFLQMDGMRFRSAAETLSLLSELKAHGIKAIDLTFYGERDYHDRFAARHGDFDFMLQMLECANQIGLNTIIDVPLNQENISQADKLVERFEKYSVERISLFVPHSEGRGATLDPVRITRSDYEALGEAAKRHFNRTRLRTEREWIVENALPHYEKRSLTISLTPENIDALEKQPFNETISMIELLDDQYHASVPDLDRLIELFGDAENEQLFNPRDLIQHYQRRYIRENALRIYDIHDERQHFVRRF